MSDHALIWVMSILILTTQFLLFYITNQHIDDIADYLKKEKGEK